MKKLMNNNVMKVMLCAGLVFGTSFGAEKEQVRYRTARRNDDREKSEQYLRGQYQRKVDKEFDRMVEAQDRALVIGGGSCLLMLYGLAWCYSGLNDLSRGNS